MPDLNFEDQAPESIKVVSVNFAYENADLIKLLKKRGEAIKE